MKEIKKIEIQRILRKNGYTLDHVSGSHHIYKGPTGQMLSVPLAKAVNGKLWQGICRQHGIPWSL